MTSLCKTTGDQKRNVPDQLTLCPFLDKMGPWIISVLQDVIPSKLNLAILGPKHCQVLQEQQINLEHKSENFRIITDGKILIHATFTEDAITRYKKRCEEQDSDSQGDWEHSIIMLEEFKVIHVSIPEKEYGEFVLQVEKFLYLGEPSVKSEEYLNLPFQFTWPEDYPDLKQRCQEVWELKLLGNNVQTDLEIIHMESTPVNSGYIQTLCKEKTADQFLIISPSEKEILDELQEWKETNEDISSQEQITKNDNHYLNKELTEINMNGLDSLHEVLQAIPPLEHEVVSKKSLPECHLTNNIEKCTSIKKGQHAKKVSSNKDWLNLLSMKSKNRQRKLSDWRVVFKRSLKSFSRLKKLSTTGGMSEKINLQMSPESSEDLITSSAPPDIFVDHHDHSYSQKNGEQNKESCSNVKCDILVDHKFSLVKENDWAENQRLIALKDVSNMPLCNNASELSQDNELQDLHLSQIIDSGETENTERKCLLTDTSVLNIGSENDKNLSYVILGVPVSDDWSNYLSDSMQVQCSGSVQNYKEGETLHNDHESEKYRSPDSCNVLKNRKDYGSSEQNISETCVESIVQKSASIYLHDDDNLKSQRQGNPVFEEESSPLSSQIDSRDDTLNVKSNQRENLVSNRSVSEGTEMPLPANESMTFNKTHMYSNELLPYPGLANEVHKVEGEALNLKNDAQKRKNDSVYPCQTKLPRSVTNKCHISSRHDLDMNLSNEKIQKREKRIDQHVYRTNSTSDSESDDERNTSEGSSENKMCVKCSYFYSTSSRTSKRLHKKYSFPNHRRKLSKDRNCRNKCSSHNSEVTHRDSPASCSQINLSKSRKDISTFYNNSATRSDYSAVSETHSKTSLAKNYSMESEVPFVCSSLRKYPLTKMPSLLPQNSKQTLTKKRTLSNSNVTNKCKKRITDTSTFNIFEAVNADNSEQYLNFQFTPRLLHKMWEKFVHLCK